MNQLVLACLLFFTGTTTGAAVCSSGGSNVVSVHSVIGVESPRGQRSWVVLLWVSCPPFPSPTVSTCEGSLIDTQWILTSASCLKCGNNASVIADIGLHYNDLGQEVDHSISRLGADRILIHPQHDIALVHIIKTVSGSLVIQLADCGGTTQPHQDTQMSSGWGQSLLKLTPMNDIHLYLWSKETCGVSKVAQQSTNDGIFCAGVRAFSYAGNVSIIRERGRTSSHNGPCLVNYGSSLVTRVQRVISEDESVKIMCEWQLCGVLSKGLSCDGYLPGLYTDVCDHKSWIINTIKEEKGKFFVT